MRTRLFRLLAATFCAALCLAPLAGCGDDATEQDLSVVHDMTAAGGDSCLQIVTCAQGCAGAAACVNACAAKGSTKGQGQYTALISCAYAACTVAHDGGTAACTSASDTGASCAACVMSSAQAPACSTQLNACLGG